MDKQLERRSISELPKVETREDGTSVIQGYAVVYNSRTNIFDLFTESIRAGACGRAIQENHDVRHLLNHDANYVLGRTKNGTLILREDIQGLWTETIPPNTQQARDVVENIRVGNIDQMSFAFVIRKQEWTKGKNGDLDHREIIDLDLYDVSSVTYPAYKDTSVGVGSRSLAEQAHRQALAEWEAREAPAEEAEPITIVSPEPYLLKVRCLRLAI